MTKGKARPKIGESSDELRLINFPHTLLSNVRSDLLADLTKEQFCILLGKRQEFEGGFCINVVQSLSPGRESYASHSIGHVSPDKEFVMYALSELQERLDVDCLIDVHTHPFAHGSVNFSGIDDRDEIEFLKFVKNNFDDVHYASIVLSQTEYEARFWEQRGRRAIASPMLLRTPTRAECITRSRDTKVDFARVDVELLPDGFLNRTALALGIETLRSLVGQSSIMVIGLGGLGSVIAENLVHMGFERLVLVDDDIVEKSNLNRIVGAYWEDAENALPKVEVVARHLRAIRPSVEVRCERRRIEELVVDAEIATLDWIVIATDSHSSRFAAQELAFKFFIPFVSAGVAITVVGGAVEDYSGEVIVVRPGDKLCLTCLNRLNPTKIAFERAAAANRVAEITTGAMDVQGRADNPRPDLQRLKGYVVGASVKEPAVKTLNSVVGALAVEQLLNQFTGRSHQDPILVYARNQSSVIYCDSESVNSRTKDCISCGVVY